MGVNMQLAQQSLNIAIFGLSLKVLKEIKLAIEKLIPKDILINWTNIADPKLQVLMVNDMFFDAPSIQKLIKNPNIRLLRLINNTHQHSKIESNILYLPIIETHFLQTWLDQSINSENKSPEQTFNKSHISQQDLFNIVKEILSPESGLIQVFDQNGIIAMVDPRNQWAWVLPENQHRVTDASLNIVYAKMNDRQAFQDIQRQDLKNWLWNLLWRSPAFHQFVKNNQCFYLKQWPQPDNKLDRHDLLKMSACFAQGASIITVAESLGLSVNRVSQFVSAALSANLGILIDHHQVKYPPQQSASQDSGFMRKFFGKLRRRLGF